ncbi:hypothetical protein L1987_64008 [Smallanthus sonchifolius]|uniref:Uncharacterized protein n=1 Tax=Smallanthus sonchifolius TaxID=185202 RepID=A0ACB9CEV9_9ASTR|nr:hypothetical protein L1987_64008 [Smallanthus sonchifolius]
MKTLSGRKCSKVKLENEDILKKFIRSLPSCWTLYTVSIRKTENLKTLQMTELFGMLKTYELEMIQAKERSSSYQTASTSTTTSSTLHSDHPGPTSSNYYPPSQTAACAAVGTNDFDWSFQKHNHNLIDQNKEFHQMKYEFKKVENNYKEKIDCLKKEISSLKHEQTNLETQIDDLLVKLKATRAELADQKSTCSDSTETNKVSSPPTCEVIKANNPSPFIPSKTVPVSQPTKQIRISYPPEGRKLTVEKGQSSTSTNSKPQSKSQQRKVFDICHVPGERAPYVQKTLEEATFEHNKAHPWNFKDLFKRKDYVFEAKATQFRNSLSPPRKHLPRPQQSCIICGESDHFAANCKFNPLKQVLHQIPLQQKPISKMKKGRHTSEVKPSAANKTAADEVRLKQPKKKPSSATKIAAAQVKPLEANKNVADQLKPKRPKDKPSAATKIAVAQVKPSTATKSTADKPKSLVATSAADKAKRAGKSPIQHWKAKIPTRIIIDISMEDMLPLEVNQKEDLYAYTDSDYGGCNLYKKSTLGDVSFWEEDGFHGSSRSKHVIQLLQQKQNTLQLQVAVHKSSEYKIKCWIMG